jgi:hypothetical protein
MPEDVEKYCHMRWQFEMFTLRKKPPQRAGQKKFLLTAPPGPLKKGSEGEENKQWRGFSGSKTSS